MTRLALSLLIIAALAVLGTTTWIARQGPQFHSLLMAQIAASGLAHETSSDFQAGWLSAHSRGRLQFADSFCKGCEVLDYNGSIHHGLGALLHGDVALASAEYALIWPQLPIEPALPPLQLSAQQRLSDGFQPALRAELALPASAHTYDSGVHQWRIAHGGLAGHIRPDALQLLSPSIGLERDASSWLELQQLSLEAAAADRLRVNADVATADIPAWHWQGQDVALRYTQYGITRNLNFDLVADVARGQIGDSPGHQASQAALHVERLNLSATRAFITELPRLMSRQVSGAARMMGLLSLYSMHGPGFFAEHPQARLQIRDLPLPRGLADVDIDLAVTEQTRRPPMHPMEWRRALQGRIDITAPPQRLAGWWDMAALMMNYITGLPRDYRDLKRQGWVSRQPDGRDRLVIILDPDNGPQKSA